MLLKSRSTDMSYKVLLAEDSLTIQKVIKITLANEPYELVDCNSEEELMSGLSDGSAQMVFLDFNLSEERSGYELCKDIKEKHPEVKVLMLFGTFDNIDDGELKRVGASDKVIKPFDSNKFIQICKSLSHELETGEVHTQEVESELEALTGDDEQDTGWTVESPEIEDQSPEEMPIEMSVPPEAREENPLEASAADWGADAPGGEGDMPPVMEEMRPPKEETPKAEEELEEHILPEADDLDYPEPITASNEPSSKLVSLDELSPAEENQVDFEEDTGEFDIQLEAEGTDTVEGVKSIEEQISDETGDDFWEADDDFTSAETPEPTPVASSVDVEFEDPIMPESGDLDFPEPIADTNPSTIEKVDESPAPAAAVSSSMPAIDAADLEAKLKPVIEDFVKEYCKNSIQKVAWEIIPDLAENLIKQELSRIADSVIRDR
jgi:CheY-like chemotaxis protein